MQIGNKSRTANRNGKRFFAQGVSVNLTDRLEKPGYVLPWELGVNPEKLSFAETKKCRFSGFFGITPERIVVRNRQWWRWVALGGARLLSQIRSRLGVAVTSQ